MRFFINFLNGKLYMYFRFIIFIVLSAILSSPLYAMDLDEDEGSGNTSSPSLISDNNQNETKEKEPSTLIFADEKFPKDSLNFLSTKFPKLKKECKRLPEEKNNYEIAISMLTGEGTPQERYVRTSHEVLKKSTSDFPLTSQEKETEKKREGLLHTNSQKSNNLTPSERFISTRHLDPKKNILEDIVLAAEQIEATIEKHGRAPVLFLGRTPDFVQVSYEELLKLKGLGTTNANPIFHLSFSGNPDAITMRKADYYQDQKSNSLRNMVTPENLAFYENYMTEKGLDKVGNKLYLIDTIGTGASLNSFLRIFRHYYETHLKTTIPEVHFICLSLPLDSQSKSSSLTWVFDQQTGFLTFKSIPEKGIRPLCIKTTPLHLSFATVKNFLDNDFCQYFLTHGIEFPAQKWNDNFKEQLNGGGKWHQEFYKWFRAQAKIMLNIHDYQIKKMTDEKQK